jgi:hypothetical protein
VSITGTPISSELHLDTVALGFNTPLVVEAPLGRFTGYRHGSSDQQREEGVSGGAGVSHTNAKYHNS